jgi:hypothetical protein
VTNENDTGDTVAANPETVEVTAATELRRAEWAWSADNDAPEVPAAQDERRPLPRSLQILLASVAVGGLALAAFILGRNGITSHRAPSAASAPPTTAAVSPTAGPPSAIPAPAPPPAAAPASPAPTSEPPTVTVTAAAPAGPPMAHGAVLGQPCDRSGPTFGYAADGSVLACPYFGHWSQTANWSGVHEIGSPCPSGDGSAVSPGGVGLVCVSSSLNGSSTWQPGP